MYILAIMTAISTAAVPQTKALPEVNPWHQMIEAKANEILAPNTKDYPNGYGQITCSPAQGLNPILSSVRDTIIECFIGTSCGQVGTAFLFRQEFDPALGTDNAILLWQETTSGYMGGYYGAEDLDGDGLSEIYIVGGTDGVARSSIAIRRLENGSWKHVVDNEACGKLCQAHDYVVVDTDDDKSNEIISVRGCELERGNEEECEVVLGKLGIVGGKFVATPIEIGPDHASNDLLDKIRAALSHPDRKEPDRNDDTTRFLQEIYDRHGLKPQR